jgi:hypothetical protein
MKKGLLLSLVASTVLFAGGDIAPVEPVAEAPVADCNDFYGHVGAGVIFESKKSTAAGAVANNRAIYGAVAVLGVTKEIFSGLTVNAEVQGVAVKGYSKLGNAAATTAPVTEAGALTQFNLGYTWSNTAFKVGRFAIPANLSPLVATPTDYFGLKRQTFDGVLVANTDIPDTTIWAAYLRNIVDHADTDDGGVINAVADNVTPNGISKSSGRTPRSIVAGGLRNTSFADTVITVAGYYDTTAATAAGAAPVARTLPLKYQVAGSIDYKWSDTDISAGAAYRAYDDIDVNSADGSDYMVGGYITQHFGAVDATFAATYVADKDTAADKDTLAAASVGFNKKYVDKTMHGYLDREGWAIGGSLSTDLSGYKLGAFGMYGQHKDYQAGASIGKTFSGIALSVDYRYQHDTKATTATNDDTNTHRVRAKAVYAF